MKIRTENILSQQQSAGWPTYATIAVWLAAVAISYWPIARYQYATLDSSTAGFAVHWPSDSKLPRQLGHSTLVLFLHPKCPCSRASLSELERLFASVTGRMAGQLDFVVDATVPKDPGDDWLQTGTLDRVKTIANARVCVDRGGIEAAAFGATTSGCVMLFDERGLRKYAGGVTECRGHEGDNAGRASLAQILCHEVETADGLPAFGCRLCLPDDTCPAATVSQTGAI
ncbi:MAG TPA: hypothetical protein VGM76_19510 [Lacipirellulaceae bacterium]|jgi:hypothetical protein